MNRLRTSIAALSACLFAMPAVAQDLTLEQLASNILTPTTLNYDPTHPDRFFAASNTGVRVVENGHQANDPFIDLSAEITAGFVEGVGGFCLHPDFASNGLCYVAYIDDAFVCHLDEYQVDGTGLGVDLGSKRAILPATPQPGPVHNFNPIIFGPDGMLYVGVGDGGSSSSDNAQDITTIFGKILRLDVDAPAPHVPPDNPFVGVMGAAEEIWHLGLRNPWRFSFDRLTGDMYIGDVGRGDIEEISFVPAGVSGANFGWDCNEGTMCSTFSPCSCGTASMIDPIFEFDHLGRCAVIGGYVYRGSAIPSLYGAYLFGDFCSGDIWALRHDGVAVTLIAEISDELNEGSSNQITLPVAFGEDPDGELYIMDKVGSEILKIIPELDDIVSYCGTSPNSLGPGANLYGYGTTSIAANDLEIAVDGVPPNGFGLPFYGSEQANIPFGDGVRCVNGGALGLARVFPIMQANASGEAGRTFNYIFMPFSNSPTAISAGETWYMQYWYRDLNGPVGGGFNLSNGLELTFVP
jgi:glucose/arabinose dehydrogenase